MILMKKRLTNFCQTGTLTKRCLPKQCLTNWAFDKTLFDKTLFDIRRFSNFDKRLFDKMSFDKYVDIEPFFAGRPREHSQEKNATTDISSSLSVIISIRNRGKNVCAKNL
jgi:hypothetical protein